MTLRPATVADIPLMMDLERACATAAHWTQTQYRQLFEPHRGDAERFVIVVERDCGEHDPETDSNLLGFLVAQRIGTEWELENVVVRTLSRRQGIGTRLLEALLARANESDSTAVFLEVRESNAAARDLYEKMGFQETGRRKGYYSDPAEDAVLYRHRLP